MLMEKVFLHRKKATQPPHIFYKPKHTLCVYLDVGYIEKRRSYVTILRTVGERAISLLSFLGLYT